MIVMEKRARRRAARAKLAPKGGPRVVAVSGGFDPLHIGHVRMLRAARKLGDRLVVIVNNDHWLRAKKGFVFMPEAERVEIIEAIEGVDEVLLTAHGKDATDRSVCRELGKIRPHVFANGGDRKPSGDPVPEAALCKELDITLVYNVGRGGKMQSSSWLTGKQGTKARAALRRTRRGILGKGAGKQKPIITHRS